ncbi:hypothetical protein AB0P17_24315 [Streptomyces sp. NPDC088124]|uniref:hypothetical protein n=1 Tax=Streptomyces sp. NPDC088124 TaxID=3154654 RepID=UPI00342B68E7
MAVKLTTPHCRTGVLQHDDASRPNSGMVGTNDSAPPGALDPPEQISVENELLMSKFRYAKWS